MVNECTWLPRQNLRPLLTSATRPLVEVTLDGVEIEGGVGGGGASTRGGGRGEGEREDAEANEEDEDEGEHEEQGHDAGGRG